MKLYQICKGRIGRGYHWTYRILIGTPYEFSYNEWLRVRYR